MTKEGKIMMIITKLIIIVLLSLALTNMAYGYYQIMRIAVPALFIFIGYIEWDFKHHLLSILCWISATVFQPFVKIAFKKDEWHQVDLIFTILLLLWILADVAIKPKIDNAKV